MSRTSQARQRERSEWIERAESVGPTLREFAAASAKGKTLAPESVAALEDAGLFTMASPLEVGGFDVHPATQVEAFEQLASVDVSSGWVAMIQAESPAMAASHLPDGIGLETVFGGQFPRVAGTANPEGVATAQSDGRLRLNGRWSFASGIRHCGWVLANAMVRMEDGSRPTAADELPPVVGSLVPLEQVEVEDSWNVMGLEGTGSCHYQLHDVIVERPFMTSFGGVHSYRGGPWFANPTITFLSPGHTGIALGSAKRALDLLTGDVGNRTRFGQAGAVADRGAFQRDYGEMSCRYEAARAYALSTLDDAMAQREAGEPITPDYDARIRAMVTWVTDTCVDVVRFAHHHGGGAAAFSDSPLQQVLRDILVASQHIFVADVAYERTGAFRLGREAKGGF
ncbi:MAG: acyl-CoA dehydrogenase family protein [Chloroflexi bacterium]|nr:acyl-CoA dehydrogenase family protein [Chloroflexota bacterium]MCY3695749.1 acyl-CoA dehydrogenase family protein [Chloroflexota bacterium]